MKMYPPCNPPPRRGREGWGWFSSFVVPDSGMEINLHKDTEDFCNQKKHRRPVSRPRNGGAHDSRDHKDDDTTQKSGEVLKILRSMAEQCRDDRGCLSCHIYGDLQEKNVLMLEEVWRTEEDLDLHLRSDEYRNLLLVLELAVKQPEIRFDTISSSTGIETIEKARGQAR